MSIIDVTTRSGRHYRIDLDARLWRRISRTGGPEFTESLWRLKVGSVLNWPHLVPEAWRDAKVPEVGKYMYISGKDVWYVSTEVVSITPATWEAP